ncbi:MAG: hypothetical protein Q9M91_04085 [Candidatus Dojkabacteria bacterium]|nr:hypothetical protein [Candidatus Dojkabacteria bacterium]MDQ7020993.1 hypothetical protein [Candidatus Dojkabacteria bacterium]
MIEIEKRSLIDKVKFNQFRSELRKISDESVQKRFTVVFVEREDFVPDKNATNDFKLRTINGTGELVLKQGNWHSSSERKEFTVKYDVSTFGDLLHMLVALGRKYGVTTYVNRYKYIIGDLTITIDSYDLMSDYWVEIEKVVMDGEDTTAANSEIDAFMQEYNLDFLDSKGTVDYITKMNNQEERRVLFDKVDIQKWVEERIDYINGLK